jgi:16S rRNA (guanine966-N2)-methyltransferase
VVFDAFALAAHAIAGAPFSLILLDPPYTLDPAKVAGLLGSLMDSGALSDDGLVSWEHARGDEPPWPEGFERVARKAYGSIEVDIAVWERGSK